MAKRKLPPEVYGGSLRLASQVLMTAVGSDVAAAEPGAREPADSLSTDRPLRADAVRNRELLITAAGAVFSAHGADVPLEDIAHKAGVGIGTLYRHFPTRDSLVEAVYRHEVDVLFVRHVATKRGMLSALKPMLSSNPAFFAETKERATAAATRLLAAGVAAGSVRADITGGDLLRAVGGVCMSTDQDRSDASDRLVGLLFDGLRHGARVGSSAGVSF